MGTETTGVVSAKTHGESVRDDVLPTRATSKSKGMNHMTHGLSPSELKVLADMDAEALRTNLAGLSEERIVALDRDLSQSEGSLPFTERSKWRSKWGVLRAVAFELASGIRRRRFVEGLVASMDDEEAARRLEHLRRDQARQSPEERASWNERNRLEVVALVRRSRESAAGKGIER